MAFALLLCRRCCCLCAVVDRGNFRQLVYKHQGNERYGSIRKGRTEAMPTRESVAKSTPVSSPLQQSVQNLRVPPRIHPSHSDGSTLLTSSPPPTSSGGGTKNHQKKPSRVISDDGTGMNRLVDQFYEQSPNHTASSRLNTPFISRTNTQEQQSPKQPINILKQTKLLTNDNSLIVEDVNRLENRVLKSVQDQVEVNKSAITDDKACFVQLQREVEETRNRISQWLKLVLENTKLIENEYKGFEKEVDRLFGILTVLDQYEIAVNSSRQKLVDNKARLEQLWKVVEDIESLEKRQKQSIRSRNKAIIWSLVVVCIAITLYKLTFVGNYRLY